MKERIVDVNYTEVNNSSDKKYSTIEEVCLILSVEAPTIVFWCNKFNYMLNIQSIGMYQIFSDNDIKNLKTIKKLNIDDNMNIGEIKTYLNQNKGTIISKKEIEVPEVSLLTVLAKILNSQNDKIETLLETNNKIIDLNQRLMENQETFTKQIMESQKEMCIDIGKKTNNSEEINDLKNEITKLNKSVNEKMTLMEKETTQRLNEGGIIIKQNMELRREKQKLIEEAQKTKSLWQRIFNK